MWRKTALSLALSAASALPFTVVSKAAMINGVASNAGQVAPSGKVQFVYGGRNYCRYSNGWHGLGWYWCGYASFGWGGPYGWFQPPTSTICGISAYN